ncbi:MAG: hypothetical protein J6P60_04995 [Lachnospiraceae bacterium]|nr:hypothetical protein [Lachnospiraceae bacterium]
MDNFVDKLNKRFNAGDIMRANAEAEEREINRAKEQAEEYERMMQEMRRLNLKNVEVTEQVQQLIQTGIEQLESYQAPEAAPVRTDAAASDSQISEALTIMKEELQGAYAQSAKESREDLREQLAQSAKESREDLREQLVQNGQKVEEVRKNVLAQTDLGRQEILHGLEDLSTQFGDQLRQTKMDLNENLAGSKEHMDQLTQKLEETKKLVGELSNKLVKGEDTTESDGSEQELLRQIREALTVLQTSVNEMQDYVHRENVKVYRNVQAVIGEVTSQKTRQIVDRMDELEKKTGASRAVMPFAMLAMLFSLAGVAVQFLLHLGIF